MQPIESLKDIEKNILSLTLEKTFLSNEIKDIEEKVIQSRNWLLKQPKLLHFLQQLQSIIQKKNIGQYSDLLTAFLQDVLEKDKEIVLNSYIYRNLPALKVEVNNNNNKEDILDGSGGSLANIVSTGLRIIALSKLKNRKFIILDESDCWLEPDKVPLFGKVLGELSQTLGVQILIISHHKTEYFKDYGRVIAIRKEGGSLVSEIVSDTPFEEEDNLNYIENIELNNFMAHRHTIIDLHPNITCLIGTNDIGKSAISLAFKALAYGDSSDTYIKHGENSATISMTFDKYKKIVWSRARELSIEHTQKVNYKYYEYDFQNPLHDIFSSNEPPDCVKENLKINLAHNFDIQIGNQKEPLFLIDSKTTPSERAKILSLGKEGLILEQMMDKLKDKTKEHKIIIKNGEMNYSVIKNKLKVLEDIDLINNEFNDFYQEYKDLIEQTTLLDSLKLKLEEYKKYQLISNIGIINTNYVEENIVDNSKLKFLLSKLKDSLLISKIEPINIQLNEEKYKDTKELQNKIQNLTRIQKISLLSKIDILENDDKLIDNQRLKSLIEQLKKNNQDKLKNYDKTIKIKEWEKSIKEEAESFISNSLHDACPTCGQHIDVNCIIHKE